MTHDLTSGKPLARIIQFTIPVLLGLLLQQVYSVVDTAIELWCGRPQAASQIPRKLRLARCDRFGGAAGADASDLPEPSGADGDAD